MKRMATIIVLATGLITGPVMAGSDGGRSNAGNVGGFIGAAVGALVGSNIGHGSGRVVATAAGAAGGFLIGREIAQSSYGGRYAPPPRADYYGGRGGYPPRGVRGPGFYPIDETYLATTTSNVRAGPGAGFAIVGRLYRHQPVRVIGKVRGRDWYMVQINGFRGYVYAPLLRPGHHPYGRYSQQDNYYRGGADGGYH